MMDHYHQPTFFWSLFRLDHAPVEEPSGTAAAGLVLYRLARCLVVTERTVSKQSRSRPTVILKHWLQND